MNHWKKGTSPHRQACGKTLAIPDAPEVTPLASATIRNYEGRFPPPDPGFARSPALLRQLFCLQQNQDLHYVLDPDSPTSFPLAFTRSREIRLFHGNLQCALKNGDPSSVAMMW